MLTVSGPEALPFERRRTSYIVCAADHRLLIECNRGEVYQREDGAEWEGDGFHVTEDASGRKSVTLAALKFD